jgi:protein-disulfide isomerase
MEGRQDERERLRAERQAAESQDVAAAQARKRRVQYLSLAAFGAVAVIVALIVISQSGSDDNNGNTPTSVANVKGVAQVSSELEGLSQSGQTLGDSSAPVTVTEFGDPQCPVCKAFADPRRRRTGKVLELPAALLREPGRGELRLRHR